MFIARSCVSKVFSVPYFPMPGYARNDREGRDMKAQSVSGNTHLPLLVSIVVPVISLPLGLALLLVLDVRLRGWVGLLCGCEHLTMTDLGMSNLRARSLDTSSPRSCSMSWSRSKGRSCTIDVLDRKEGKG